MTQSLKGRTKIVDGQSRRGDEVRVINGRMLVRFVPRTIPAIERDGYGNSRLANGTAKFGEANVINGALKVSS